MADRKWSDGETVALIEAWRPLRNRSRAHSTRSLATADWRAVATAVNKFRTDHNLNGARTHKQCQRRLERLKRRFGEDQLATPSWYGFVLCGRFCNDTAGRRRLSSLPELASAAMEALGGDECGGGAAGGQARSGSVLCEGSSATPAEVQGVHVGAATKEDEGGTATGAPSEDPPSGPVAAAAMDFLAGPIPKKRRTGAAEDGRSPSIEEELVREANARGARVEEGRAPAGRFAATVPEIAAELGEALAAVSNDAAVVGNLSEMYREVAMKRIELQAQIVAALAATTVGADGAPRT